VLLLCSPLKEIGFDLVTTFKSVQLLERLVSLSSPPFGEFEHAILPPPPQEPMATEVGC